MYNRVILMGRMTRDPELRTTQSGIAMCRFSIAVDRRFGKSEDKQTDFFDVTAWRQTAEFVSKYFTKGRMIHVEGSIQNNNYTDQNGVKHYATAIMADQVSFCGDRAPEGSSQYKPSQANIPQSSPAPQRAAQNEIELGDLGDFEEILSDEEVPF